MKEVTEKYYITNDNKKFKDENECKEYEEALLKVQKLRKEINDLNKELACAEYVLHKKDIYIKSVIYAGGNGHDGYYSKCPHCEELVGGYEGRNTSFKVDTYTYKCEKCGNFFTYR